MAIIDRHKFKHYVQQTKMMTDNALSFYQNNVDSVNKLWRT